MPGVNAGKDELIHECKKTVARSLLRIQILEPTQKHRHIVPRLVIQFDILDANLAALELRNVLPREDCPNSAEYTPKSSFLYETEYTC